MVSSVGHGNRGMGGLCIRIGTGRPACHFGLPVDNIVGLGWESLAAATEFYDTGCQ
jgi:hypothetical protein